MQIENNRVPEVLKDCHFQIACDVTNPLCGVEGCVYVFGAQKGVKEEEKREHGQGDAVLCGMSGKIYRQKVQ